MKRVCKKLTAAAMVAILAMTMNCIPAANFGAISPQAVEVNAASAIVESGGWLESSYVEWEPITGADGYNSYVKGSGDSNYTRIDNELIRAYAGYYRADAVGLKAGTYTMQIVPVVNGAEDTSKALTTGNLEVKANDRSGFAFHSSSRFKTGSGAYNDDGTLKSGAKVVYVTGDTAKTVTADIITSSKGATTTCTGLQAIIDAKQKGYDTTPLAIRILGTIDAEDMDSFSSSEEGLQIKGKNSYAELNITMEGIGEDAVIRGFGFLLRNAGNVELRNFAIMNCMDDCISIDTDNCNIWVHNIDLFYGQAGSANDQAKGDGTIDIKGDSQYITVSYNHLLDSGKASLCGMTGESGPNYITYHHNWFDHSDSRHPRIRTMSVHVYNNFFDGNSKYGVGAAKDSSAFVENNVFEDCKHPMLSSLQGSDIMENSKTGAPDFSAKGTFSGENGGIIKAYNNKISGSDADKFNGGVEPVYYDATATGTNGKATQFDAYLASSRDEVVPSTVKALVGGVTYDNTTLAVSNLNATPESVDTVVDTVTTYAGRMNGGDFFERTGTTRNDYVGLTDATSDAVDTTLKAALSSYTSGLLSVGGSTIEMPETTTSTETESTTEATTSAPVTEGSTETTTSSLEALTAGTYAAADVIADTAKFIVSGNSGKNGQIKIDDSGSITFNVAAGANVSITYKCGSSDSSKSASISCAGVKGETLAGSSGTNPLTSTLELTNLSAGEYTITATQSGGTTAQINSIVVSYSDEPTSEATSEATTEATTQSTSETTTESTTQTTTESTTESTTVVVADGPWGDADNSGKISANDAAAILHYVLSPESTIITDELLPYCDVDGQDGIKANDAALVLQKARFGDYIFPASIKK